MIGTTLAHYEVTALIGKGGMGEVYRARDTRLEREVALKLLPADLADDTERLARFHREARTLASLHHARIAALFGIEESDARVFLVMELVEGQDLSEQLAQRGALPIDDVLSIATQMAEGLEFAHEKGIMHRDLKPANVKLTPEGEVKILDFGLARAFTGDPIDESDLANSPTITAALTQAGVVLGTAAYMSPEQAKGKSVDRRADIWSYGVVLFELLTGERLFRGETASETMADVMKGDIDGDRLPKNVPFGLRRLLERCLDRDAHTRLRDIGEARIMLSATDESPATIGPAGSASRLPWIVASLAAVIAVGAVVWGAGRAPDVATPTVRTQADLLAGPGLGYDVSDVHFDLSPDGRRLAFSALDDEGDRWIYLRDLSSGELRRLEGSRDGEVPFWSPDGTRVGFFVAGGLSIVGIDDGIVERNVLTMNSWAMDPGWHTDGWIVLMANDARSTIYRAAPTGGELEPLLQSEHSDVAFCDPEPLPGGALMYTQNQFAGGDGGGVYVLRDGENRQILSQASDAHWVPAHGALVYRLEQRIFARRFDPESLEFLGDPVRIGGPVRTKTFPDQGYLSVAEDGTLVYVEGDADDSDTEFVWVDRTGAVVEDLGVTGDLYSFDISHDGRRVAFDSSTAETAGDIWVYDFGRRSSVRLTDHELDESSPVWSPDDGTIYFFRGADLMRVNLSGPPAVETLRADDASYRPHDTHPGTGQLIFGSMRHGDRDLMLFDPETNETETWLDSDGRQRSASFSPSGDWVAYTDERAEGSHVWVESFPDRRERFRVSNDEGGGQPRWRRDGREIFYVSTNRQLMAVPVAMDATDRRPVGEPVALFRVNLRQDRHYDVGPDGDRFLLNRFVGEVAVPHAVLVRGWDF